jgi:hypothetical protein
MGSVKDNRPLKRRGVPDQTDRSRWRLRSDDALHTWHYLEDDEAAKKWPLSLADKYYLDIPLVFSDPLYCFLNTNLFSPESTRPFTP